MNKKIKEEIIDLLIFSINMDMNSWNLYYNAFLCSPLFSNNYYFKINTYNKRVYICSVHGYFTEILCEYIKFNFIPTNYKLFLSIRKLKFKVPTTPLKQRVENINVLNMVIDNSGEEFYNSFIKSVYNTYSKEIRKEKLNKLLNKI
jgi:hypothetical protein